MRDGKFVEYNLVLSDKVLYDANEANIYARTRKYDRSISMNNEFHDFGADHVRLFQNEGQYIKLE